MQVSTRPWCGARRRLACVLLDTSQRSSFQRCRYQAADGQSNNSDYGRDTSAVPRKRRRGFSAGRDGSDSAELTEQRRRHVNGVAALTSADARAVWVQSKRVDVALSQFDLTELFSHFGCVRQVDVPTFHAEKLPFAFVHFESEQAAQLTLQRAGRAEFEHVTVCRATSCGRRRAPAAYGAASC